MPSLSTQLTSLALPPHLSVNSPDVAKPIESSASSASGLNHTAGEGIGLLREPDTDVEPEIGDGEDGYESVSEPGLEYGFEDKLDVDLARFRPRRNSDRTVKNGHGRKAADEIV